MKLKRGLPVILCISLILLALSGCHATSPTAGTTGNRAADEQAEADSPRGRDNLEVSVNADVSQFCPYITNSFTDIMALLQIYEPLVYVQGTGFVPGLADSWEINPEFTKIKLHLRPGATFHNGEPCRAEDVVYTFEKALARPSATSSRERYREIKAIDAETVEITLGYPVPAILSYLASPGLCVISKNYVEANGEEAFLKPMGTGAYILKKWEKGSRVQFEAYEGYNGKKAKIKFLNFNVVKDSSTALVSLESGNNDFIVNIQDSDIQLVEKNSDLVLQTAPSRTTSTLVFNIRRGVMADENLRRAIAFGIDRNAINLTAYEGKGFMATGAYEGDAFYSGKDFSFPYDLDKARSCLADSSYDGSQAITIKTADAYGDVIPQVIQGQMAELGIKIKIETLEMNAHSQDYLNGDFEIIFAAGSSIIPDLYSSLHGSYYFPDNCWSPSSPEDDRFNAELDAMKAENDAAKKTAMADQMMQELFDLCNEVPLITKMSNIVFRQGLKGSYVDPSGMFYCFRDFSWE